MLALAAPGEPLSVRLSAGTAQNPTEAEPIKIVEGEPLDDTVVASIFDRLPEWLWIQREQLGFARPSPDDVDVEKKIVRRELESLELEASAREETKGQVGGGQGHRLAVAHQQRPPYEGRLNPHTLEARRQVAADHLQVW